MPKKKCCDNCCCEEDDTCCCFCIICICWIFCSCYFCITNFIIFVQKCFCCKEENDGLNAEKDTEGKQRVQKK